MNTITDSLWSIVSQFICLKKSKVGRSEYDTRKTFEAIHHVLREGGRWSSLEKIGYGKRSTIHGKFKKWCENGTFKKILDCIKTTYESNQSIQYNWYAVDTTSKQAPFYKEGGPSATNRGRNGIKYILAADRMGAPLYVDIGPGNRHDSKLFETILQQLSDKNIIKIVAADAAYDQDSLYKRSAQFNIALIACVNPRRNKTKKKTYVWHRWIIEQTFGILMQNRGLKTCYAKLSSSILAFLQLACAIRVFSML
jgi:transposase